MQKKKLIVLSGAGISAESGIKTFRDANGLWEGHNVMDVATPEAWHRNQQLVLDFYNQRRRQLHDVKPNSAHIGLAELEASFEVHIITQNVDDLHERAGSTNVLHVHGELFKARSVQNREYIVNWQSDLTSADKDPDGYQLRPHIVWFGEDVPAFEEAITLSSQADIFVVVGTSLQVYPAAGLLSYTPGQIPIIYIDPKPATIPNLPNPVEVISMGAIEGVKILKEKLKQWTDFPVF